MQIYVIQYEELTGADEKEQLNNLKEFIGLHPDLPFNSSLGLVNARKHKIQPDGWYIKKDEYQKLIDVVKPDVLELLDDLERHGHLQDKAAWLQRWEDVWNSNLKSCNDVGSCTMVLS